MIRTAECVSPMHPDKMCDRISDTLLDLHLRNDPESRVAIETAGGNKLVYVTGEVTSEYKVSQQEIEDIVREVTKDDNIGVIINLNQQSPEIANGVDTGGAGDQGIMFGYATDETHNYIPLALDLSHKILIELAALRRDNKDITYLRPDSKSQVTIEYTDQGEPLRIDTIVVSTQHDQFLEDDEQMLEKIKSDIINIAIKNVIVKEPDHIQKLFNDDITYHINPTGKFVIGGPHGDTGLTGRKIIVDTYGGKGAHGGGAFSGKDPSKVDRSAAYAARHIAKNLVAAGVAKEILVQLSYAIGVVEPTSININTYNTSKVSLSDPAIADKVSEIFDLRPFAIENRLKLRNPIYLETAAYGHMGRQPKEITKIFESPYSGRVEKTVELFTWEKLDYLNEIKNTFKL